LKAIRIHGAHDVRLEDVARPTPAPDESLIRIKATGICGTDVEIQDGTMAYFTRGMASYPVTPGHEWVGEIVTLGGEVTGFDVGDRVVGECSVGCMKCKRCVSGNYHQCAVRTETGILNRDGSFAEFIVFPALFLHKISKDIDIRAGAMVEPTAIALNGVKCAQVSPLDRIAIHGDGPIGLLILMVAKAYGAQHITLIGATPSRLEMGKSLGADVVIDAAKEDVAKTLSKAGLPSVSIEATGIPEAAATALQTTTPGGRVVLQGLFGGRMLNGFDLDHVVINDLKVIGAIGSPNIWPDVIALIEQGRIDPLAIVTHELGLSDFKDGLDLVTSREGIKVLLLQ